MRQRTLQERRMARAGAKRGRRRRVLLRRIHRLVRSRLGRFLLPMLRRAQRRATLAKLRAKKPLIPN
jgi:hypothetical protein